MIAVGASLESALELAIEVETLAEMYWRALQVGEPCAPLRRRDGDGPREVPDLWATRAQGLTLVRAVAREAAVAPTSGRGALRLDGIAFRAMIATT